MDFPRIHPVQNTVELKDRIEGFFNSISKTANPKKKMSSNSQLDMRGLDSRKYDGFIESPRSDVNTFLNLVSAAIPDGDVYLFGGLIRDLAIFGREGFKSDIDVVVDGGLGDIVHILIRYGAKKNKFGGYRLLIDRWEIDIWEAQKTWAIKNGLVKYEGISSLTETTVLNWDAILMNWRTKNFIFKPAYFEEIHERALDVVLNDNPNRLGMTIRILRHLRHKDATKISYSAIRYLVKALNEYNYQTIKNAELESYGTNLIDKIVYDFFKRIGISSRENMINSFKSDVKINTPIGEGLDIQLSLF